MPIRKIADLPEPSPIDWCHTRPTCLHPEHNAPGMILLEPGVYEHTCPACGEKQMIVQPYRPTLEAW